MYTILKYAAMQGFKPLTVPMMQRLISYLEIDEAPRPTTEAQCATTLIKHVCPAIEDDVLAFYLGQRHMRVKPKVDTLLPTDLIHCTSGIMAEAETDEAMRDINNFKRDVEALKTVALKLKSSNATNPNKLNAFAPGDSAALEAARAYLPPGATLSQEGSGTRGGRRHVTSACSRRTARVAASTPTMRILPERPSSKY